MINNNSRHRTVKPISLYFLDSCTDINTPELCTSTQLDTSEAAGFYSNLGKVVRIFKVLYDWSRPPGKLDLPLLDGPLLRRLPDHPQLPEDDLTCQAKHPQQAQLLLCLLRQLFHLHSGKEIQTPTFFCLCFEKMTFFHSM